MPSPRRLWDSNIVLDYLGGRDEHMEAMAGILGQGTQGNLEIVVSTLAIAEVAYLDGFTDERAEQRIREFFGREYVIVAAIDERVGEVTQGVVRKYHRQGRVNPRDALHLATAIRYGVPIVETTDKGFLFFDRLEGEPAVRVRHPLYEGNLPLPGV